MIAQIYPLKRMPRKCRFFDYLVPDTLELKRGDLVTIPFRKLTVYGVVANVSDHSTRGIALKHVKEYTGVTLKEDELSFFESVAYELAQSIPSILYHVLPRPPKRLLSSFPTSYPRDLTIPNDEASTISRQAHELSKRRMAFVHASDLRRTAAVISKYLDMHPQQKCLVVAPTVNDVHLLERHLGRNDGSLTGEETNNERFAQWQGFRQKTHGCFVGTKLALMLVDSTISTIFLVRSGHKSHKQSDRNPRFDARLMAFGIADRFQSNLYFFDTVPRVDDIGYFSSANIISSGATSRITIVNKQKEFVASPHPTLSYSASVEITQALTEQKQVLCVYNKKGKGQRLACQDCKQLFVCEQCQSPLKVKSQTLHCIRCSFVGPMHYSCPSCRSTNIFEKGFGNERVQEALSQLFGVQVGVIDKEHPEWKTTPILLVTQYFYEHHFNPFKPSSIGLVVLLDADAPLFQTSFRALEKTLQRTEEWRGLAFAHKATFLIQTDTPELFEDFYANAQELFETELAQRVAYELPPKRRWMQITYKDDEHKKAVLQADLLTERLKALPTNLQLVGPVFDEKNQWHLDVGVIPQDTALLLNLFISLDDQYIIDTNAFSC